MQNLYTYDRLGRLALVIVLLYFSNIGLNLYLLAAIGLLATSFTGFCPAYWLLNINKSYLKQNTFMDKLPKNNPEPVFIFSQEGKILFQNPSSQRILPTLNLFTELSPKDTKQIIENEEKFSIKYKHEDKVYMLEIAGIKEESFIFAYGFNITEIENSKEKLKQQNITDSLTKLGNRNKLLEDIQNRTSDNLSLFVFDIVKFSQINGFYGHKKGDEFLKQFAEHLDSFQKSLNIKTYSYRLRGNTFALLLDLANTKKEEKPPLLKNTLNDLFETFANFRIHVNDIATNIEIRVGISAQCEVSDEQVLCLSLLNNAETALSEAKEKYVSFLFFRDIRHIHERYKDNLNWASKLHSIFEHKSEAKIKAYYQAIYNLKSKKIEKFEALVRIEDANVVISPFRFLNVAKQINFLPKITKEVFTQALKTFKNTNYEFSLNLTTQDLKDEKLLDYLQTELEKNDVKASSIVLEILEDEDIYEYTDTIAKLKEKGFKLAIDDFGVGYSNFQKLQLLNVDYIKIDGSLVKNIASNSKDLSIINSICTYAKTIGVKTIAEFVADEKIFDLIKASGIDYVQGYYISEPKATIDIEFDDK